MKRLGLLSIILSLFPLYLVATGVQDAASVGPIVPIGPVGWILIVLFLVLLLGGIGLFVFAKT